MWCRTCQQDVPATAVSAEGQRLACPRCHGQLNSHASENAPASSTASEDIASEQPALSETLHKPPQLDDWNLDHDLAAVTRLMQTMRAEGAAASHSAPCSAEFTASAWRTMHTAHVADNPGMTPRLRNKRSTLFAWPALMLGMMSFACGAVLLCWSFATGRNDLWTYGLPAVLAGQGLLVLGLVLQLDGLWQNHRETHETLGDLDRELAELRHATTILTTSQSAAGQSFYAHMAEGASPHLLLADVKGQLDLIAARLAKAKDR